MDEKHSVNFHLETEKNIGEMAKAMTQGIKKWERVLYPMMVAFIILAAYGFYLIVSITKDMHHVSQNMSTISENMMQMTANVAKLTNQVNQRMESIDNTMQNMHSSMNQLNNHVKNMDQGFLEATQAMQRIDTTLTNMNNTLNGIHQSVYFMGYSANNMSANLSELNGSISTPMNSINSMLPWSAMPQTNRNQYAPTPYLPALPMNPALQNYPTQEATQ